MSFNFNGVAVTQVTLDGVPLTSLTVDGVDVIAADTGPAERTNLHDNSAMVPGTDNSRPTDFLPMSGSFTYADIGDGNFSCTVNPANDTGGLVGFKYDIDAQHNNLETDGRTYRYEVDMKIINTPDSGEYGIDHSRGSPTGVTIVSEVTLASQAALALSQYVTVSVDFTLASGYALEIRHGINLGSASTNGTITFKNPRLIDMSEVLGSNPSTTYTHSHQMLSSSALPSGQGFSSAGGSIDPTTVDTFVIVSLTSIGAIPAITIQGAHEGALMDVWFDNGMRFDGVGVIDGPNTTFLGTRNGVVLSDYFEAKALSGDPMGVDLEYTAFVPTFSGNTHNITPDAAGDGIGVDGQPGGFSNSSGYDVTVTGGGELTPLPIKVGKGDIVRLTALNGSPMKLYVDGTDSVGDMINVYFDSGAIAYTAIGFESGGQTRFVSTNNSDALVTYFSQNNHVFTGFEIDYINEEDIPAGSTPPVVTPGGPIHTLTTVDYAANTAGNLLYVDHTNDAGDSNFDTNEFKSRYDQDWASNNGSLQINNGFLEATCYQGQDKKGINSTGNLDGDYNEIFISYEMQFDTNFDFVLGGKMFGLVGRPGATGAYMDGGANVTANSGFSCRMMFRPDGLLQAYIYHEDMTNKWGHEIDCQHEGSNFKVVKGNRYLVEVQVKMNTGSNRDGLMVIKINGNEVMRKTNFRFCANGSYGINGKYIQLWHGGSGSEWAPSQDSDFSWNHYRVSTSPLEY